MTPAELDNVLDLASAVCSGEADARQFEQLQQLLRRDPQARQVYIAYLDMHAELHWGELSLFAENSDATNVADESCSPGRKPGGFDRTTIAAGLPPGAPAPVAGPTVLSRLIGRINTPGVYSLITAASVLFAGLTLLRILEVSWPVREVAQSTPEKTVAGLARVQAARVTKTHRAEWVPSSRALRVGSLFNAGEPLELRSGMAELTFTSGASVLLVGPTRFQVETPRRGRLLAGELTATVPVQAAGYVIATPHADIVDLGTEFGVRVDDEGAEVHVFRGAVRVEDERQSQQFGEGEACFAAADSQDAAARFTAIAYAADRFVRGWPAASAIGSGGSGSDLYARAVLASGPVAYWRLNEIEDEMTAIDSSGRGYDQDLGLGGFTGALLSRTGRGDDVGPRPSDTVGGRPLLGFEADNNAPTLDGAAAIGNSMYAVDSSPNNAILRVGYGSNGPVPASVVPADTYTVEFWLRPLAVPDELNPAYLFQRLGVDAGDNERPGGGVLGGEHFLLNSEMQLSFLDGIAYREETQTALAPNQWVHLALVRVTPDAATTSTVRIYHNGELHSEFPGVELADAADHLDNGNWVFGARRDRPHLKLPGNLDEIAIYARPLDRAEIETHFNAAIGSRKTSIAP